MDYPKIIAIGDILVSTALLTERFACDMAACKGWCCVAGNSGAPLEPEEMGIIEREYSAFAPYMNPQGRAAVQQQGFVLTDTDGELVTPLISQAECAYACFDESGICRCAVEQAFEAGTTAFRKPISCWLYPVRVQKLATGYALNYHQWEVCANARTRGQQEGIPVYRFVKEALIAKFGAEFYEALDSIFSTIPATIALPHTPCCGQSGKRLCANH